MAATGSKIWLASYNSEEIITIEMVHNLQRINMQSKNKIAFVAWMEEKNEEVFQKDLNKTTDAAVISATERIDILFPGCKPFDSMFQKTCAVSDALAYELFGFKNVKNQQIIYKERSYVISDIFDNSNKMFIFYDDQSDRIYNEITVLSDFTKSQKVVKDVVEERMGIRLKIIDYRFFGFIYDILFSLLFCSGVFFLIKQIKNMIPTLSSGIKKEDKINTFFMIILILINCFIFVHLSGIPVDMIPTRFSDKDFWIRLIDEQKENLRFMWMKEKSYLALGWFEGRMTAGLGIITGGVCWCKYKKSCKIHQLGKR